jgi:flagellar hook-length control protein FliK
MKVNSGPPGGKAPGSAVPARESGPKESKSSADQTQGKKFENLLEEKPEVNERAGAQAKLLLGSKGLSPDAMLKGKNLKLPEGVVQQEDAALTETLTGEQKEGPVAGKAFKSLLDQHQDTSADDGCKPGAGYEGLPLSAYLEPAAPTKPVETVQHAGLQVHEIEKMVDRVLVGVNATGEPEMRMDVHLDSLGPLNIQVTRGEEGLKIHFNAQTENAGIQLGQNLAALQQTLSAKGLQVADIQLLVANEPLAMNSLIDQPKAGSTDRVLRKDRAQKATAEKLQRSTKGPS